MADMTVDWKEMRDVPSQSRLTLSRQSHHMCVTPPRSITTGASYLVPHHCYHTLMLLEYKIAPELLQTISFHRILLPFEFSAIVLLFPGLFAYQTRRYIKSLYACMYATRLPSPIVLCVRVSSCRRDPQGLISTDVSIRKAADNFFANRLFQSAL